MLDTLARTPVESELIENFSHSLVEVIEDEKVIHKRSQPSAHYLNPDAFNSKLFKGYFMVWIPSTLTTLGVLGTFVGLQIGLGGINLEGEVGQMLEGIRMLIEGAKTAFNTSIFGVGAGIIFGLSLRVARQRQRNQIEKLCNLLDRLIPEGSPEDDLHRLRGASENSVAQLVALREEVGPSLQETLAQMPGMIGQAVGNQIQDVVGDIGQQNAQELGVALREIYENHMGDLAGLGQAITAQLGLTNQILEKLEALPPRLESTSENLRGSSEKLAGVAEKFGNWDASLGEFSNKLDSAGTSFETATKNLQNASEHLNTIGEVSEGLVQAGQMAVPLNGITGSLESIAQAFAQVNDQAIGTQFENATHALQAASENLDNLGPAAEQLENAGNLAQDLFRQAGKEHVSFIYGLSTGVAALNEQISQLLKQYNHNMAEQTTQRIQQWNNEATNFGINFTGRVDELNAAIEYLQESLNQLDNKGHVPSKKL